MNNELSNLLIKEIERLRNTTQGNTLSITLSPDSKLKQFSKAAILQELRLLENNERILELKLPKKLDKEKRLGVYKFDTEKGKIKLIYRKPGFGPPVVTTTSVKDSEVPIRFEVKPTFRNWLATYKIKKDYDLQNLSSLNLGKIYCTVLDIDEKFQVDPHPTVSFSQAFSSYSDLIGYNYPSYPYRVDALKFLKTKGIISGYNMPTGTYARDFRVVLDVPKFLDFKPQIIEAHMERVKEAFPPEAAEENKATNDPSKAADIIYEVTYPDHREILINGFIVSKPAFDGENENIFEYVFNRPNQVIELKELREALDGALPEKTLPKIVENWGFTRDLKKLFFKVSSQSIYFRNPIYSKDLEAVGIRRLRISRK